MSNEELNDRLDEWEGTWGNGSGWYSLGLVVVLLTTLLLAAAIW